jgi:hypothetical protein
MPRPKAPAKHPKQCLLWGCPCGRCFISNSKLTNWKNLICE